MELSVEQRIEMNQEMRELRRIGQPEVAEKIKTAMAENRFYLGETVFEVVDLPDRPPTHGPGSSAKAWREYATVVSDFDAEIIESTVKQDLILMLEAYDL